MYRELRPCFPLFVELRSKPIDVDCMASPNLRFPWPASLRSSLVLGGLLGPSRESVAGAFGAHVQFLSMYSGEVVSQSGLLNDEFK
jgi:hypothetical protein